MFFPELITAIRGTDRVLEIGPGASPHFRSNSFLELSFDSEQVKIAQRGGGLIEANFGERPVYRYCGGRFPFDDNQFDYVICSHVIEHVEDPCSFLSEVFRVAGGRGYLEYPLITYEYLYNFDVHLHFIKFDSKAKLLRYIPKKNTSFGEFSAVQSLFYKMLELGWDDLCAANRNVFFEGIEFLQPFLTEKTNEIGKLMPSDSFVIPKRKPRLLIDRIQNKLGL